MAGMIKQAMGPAADEQEPQAEAGAEAQNPGAENAEPVQEPAGQPGGAGAGGEMTPQAVRDQMQLPDNLKEAYDRVVLAGMKVMFDKQTHDMAMKVIQGDGPIDERLGTGIAALMGTLVKQSNGTMPPQVIIPAGVELLVAAGDYLKKSGAEPITDDQIGGALAIFVQHMLEQAGVKDPQQLQQMLQQLGGGMPEGAPQPGGAPQPAAGGPAAGGMPGGAGGMVAGQMAGG